MVQTEIVPAKSIFGVKRGDIWQLGKHRLMCGDAQSQRDVTFLFASSKAEIVVTSPPYADAREYKTSIPCWDTMMFEVFSRIPETPTTQLLVNLGTIHRRGEWTPYWWNWLQSMRKINWRHASLFVWDKINGVPVFPSHGIPTPQHEFVFAFRRKPKKLNKTVHCKLAGKKESINQRLSSGCLMHKKKKPITICDKKTVGSVVTLAAELVNRTGHPAVFPIGLPKTFIESYSDEGNTVYDPFAGTATTLLACEMTNRQGFGMEIAPEYVEMALKRWLKLHPDQMPTLIDRSC